MIDPEDVRNYSDEAGDTVSVYECPECGTALRVEFRKNLPAHMIGLACPHGCVGLPVRIRDAARLDEAFVTGQPPYCLECQDEIVVADHPETDDGYPLHPGECAAAYREQMDRLEATRGGSD